MMYLQNLHVVNPILWQHNYITITAETAVIGTGVGTGSRHLGRRARRGGLGDLTRLCSKAGYAFTQEALS